MGSNPTPAAQPCGFPLNHAGLREQSLPFESARPNWDIGDPVILAGNRHFRLTATIPVERIAEFVHEPLNGVLEVEPLQEGPEDGADDYRRPPSPQPRRVRLRWFPGYRIVLGVASNRHDPTGSVTLACSSVPRRAAAPTLGDDGAADGPPGSRAGRQSGGVRSPH